MILVVGLGNPGKIYINSRHNVGFKAIEKLSKILQIALKKDRGTFSLSGKGKIKEQDVILAMPQTFMNLSGIAVRQLIKKYKIDLAKLLVVCDDLDLEFGRLKIKPSGSSGGHRGIKSIIDSLGSQNFTRLRIGIGRPDCNLETAEFVLSTFNKTEKRELKKILHEASICCQSWAVQGITQSMDTFNKRSRK